MRASMLQARRMISYPHIQLAVTGRSVSHNTLSFMLPFSSGVVGHVRLSNILYPGTRSVPRRLHETRLRTMSMGDLPEANSAHRR